MKIKYILGKNNNDLDIEKHIISYLKNNAIIETKNLLLDINNIFNRYFMCCVANCDICVEKEEYNSLEIFNYPGRIINVNNNCCNGGCYDISRHNARNINENIDGICKYLDVENVNLIRYIGWQEDSDNTLKTRCLKNNSCIFNVIKNDVVRCALHLFAIDNDKNLFDFKPFNCISFPLDIIKVNNKYLITSVSENTREFVRWKNINLNQSCLNRHINSVPVYLYSKNAIIYALGENEFDLIDSIYKNNKWKKLL